jgi:D-alanyl-D-alanine carboxypeptidase/D-alanyl-D-alanine-endopeptidase (penicillin-binding protein 4)
MPKFLALLLCAAALAPGTLAQERSDARADMDMLAGLAPQIDALLDEEELANAWWGIAVENLETGEMLYARNTGLGFVPASNTKLYTSAAALDLLGPDYRYETVLFADGPVERTPSGGVLRGNLVVRGSGDPTIGGRFSDGDLTATFRAWADSLKARGITRVDGDLIGDDDVFDDVALGYGWSWDDELYWYSAELGGLVFNDNCVDVSIEARQAGQPGRVTWEPMNTSYVQVVNQSLTVPRDSSLEEGYARPRGTNTLYLSSLVPEGRTDRESLTVSNPTLYFAHVLRETLVAEGISVGGVAVDIDDLSVKPDAARLRRLATHHSPPLAEIVAVVNKRSQNLYADQVLKTLGTLALDTVVSSREGFRERDMGSALRGVQVASSTFHRAGVPLGFVQLVDGSGLSRQNIITPAATLHLLRYMWRHEGEGVREAYLASLPIGGVDGTLRGRFRGEPNARGNVRAKTGTLSNASALSGYVTTRGGTPLAFAIMVNHYTTSSRPVRAIQDDLVEVLAAQD